MFGWLWPQDGLRFDDQTGYNCAIFRNESERRSSEVILEAERIAFERWGPNRLYTYVKPSAIRSVNPGYCFKMAGWKFIRTSKDGKLHLLTKEMRTKGEDSPGTGTSRDVARLPKEGA